MTGTITLNKISNINGKPAYQGLGTVLGFPGITLSVYWIGSPDNVWVLDYEGQPYFYTTCNTLIPPSTSNVSCNWVTVDGTDCPGAAPLVINGSGTLLPVGLFGFSARAADKEVSLAWKTASEINNQGFEIQRSKDAVNWNKIGFVNGAINSSLEKNYNFNDVAPLSGKNFYRLVQYDLDGKETFSSVINADFIKEGQYTLGSNPGNGIYLLNIQSASGATLFVSDMTGRKLFDKKINSGIQQLDISKYAKGTYLLHLQIGTATFTEKLIKL